MATYTPTPEEMSSRIARFRELRPKQSRFQEQSDIPPEAISMIAAKELFLFMAPQGLGGANQSPGIFGLDGLVVNIAKCPPGQGPELHAHDRTVESFMVLRGQFEIRWGDKGEHATVLDEFDMISIPPKVMRAFANLTQEDGLLLVLIQGDNRNVASDVQYAPSLGDKLAGDYGPEVREKIENMGWRFDAELGGASREEVLSFNG